MAEMSWKDAIIEVLRSEGAAMHYSDIAERIVAERLRKKVGATLTSDQCIEAMEALLIEALEPPQNRRRGDGFSGVEFIQVEDPEIKRATLKAALAQLEVRL